MLDAGKSPDGASRDLGKIVEKWVLGLHGGSSLVIRLDYRQRAKAVQS
jgi:hypothetical protein